MNTPVFLSGQDPTAAGKPMVTGKVGAEAIMQRRST
jgi:hypothetical protein